MGKVLTWIYAITGSVYLVMYLNEAEGEVVHRYATGPLFLLMVVAPIVLILNVAPLILPALMKGR